MVEADQTNSGFDSNKQLETKGDAMKKLLYSILAVVILCALSGNLSSAKAASYTFTIVNNLNSYIPAEKLNANAECRVTVNLTTGSGVVATGTLPSLKAATTGTIKLSPAVCNLQKVIVTCRFKDHTGKEKTETKESGFANCGGGTYYISLEPFLNPQWTSFAINKY